MNITSLNTIPPKENYLYNAQLINQIMDKNLFWIFGSLQAITLGLIIFFILHALNTIGLDTQILLSILFPLFMLIVEYLIYSKK